MRASSLLRGRRVSGGIGGDRVVLERGLDVRLDLVPDGAHRSLDAIRHGVRHIGEEAADPTPCGAGAGTKDNATAGGG